MILSIRIKDNTYQKYVEKDTKVPQRAIERAVEKYADADGKERFVLVRGKALDQAEKTLGTTLSNDNIEDLGNFMERMSSVRVDGMDIPLSKGQRYRLERESEFYKRPFDELLKERLIKVLEEKWGV
jgi:hypothetical protein